MPSNTRQHTDAESQALCQEVQKLLDKFSHMDEAHRTKIQRYLRGVKGFGTSPEAKSFFELATVLRNVATESGYTAPSLPDEKNAMATELSTIGRTLDNMSRKYRVATQQPDITDTVMIDKVEAALWNIKN